MDIKSLSERVLNDVTKPILFVSVLTLLFAFFADWIASLDIFLQFILVGLPISFVVFYYFGKLHDGWMYLLALFANALAWDLVLPPYAVDLNGIINTQVFLSGSAIDTFVGTIWQGFGVNGFMLFVLTYPVTFAVLYTISVFLVKMAHKR